MIAELIFVGMLIGVSVTVLALHFAHRLRPMRGAEDAYAGNQFNAIGMDLNGRGHDEIDPQYLKAVATVLKQPEGETPWRTLLP